MLSESHRWYLCNALLETGPGEMAWARSSIHHGRKRRKGAKKKRKCLHWTCLCWVLLLTRGFPRSPVRQSNMKRTLNGSWTEYKNNYWQSGSDSRVGGVSAKLAHPPTLRFECEALRTYRRASPSFFPHRKTFHCGLLAQAHPTHFRTHSSNALMAVFLFPRRFCPWRFFMCPL